MAIKIFPWIFMDFSTYDLPISPPKISSYALY